jgi:hypothetical protein
MRHLWIFGARVALAASYLTLAITNEPVAADLAAPYAAAVLGVAIVDLRAAHRGRA